MKHILAAVDFSDLTDRVVAQSADLAQTFGARVTLLHVAAPNPEFIGLKVGPQTVRDARAKELHAEHDDLHARAEGLCQRGLDATALLIEGATVDTILEEVERLECDTIVIGTHGHGALYQAIFGSVRDGVVHQATCPVVVVPRERGQ